MQVVRLCLIAGMLMASCAANADDQARFQQPQQGKGRLWVPPPEAFMACDGKKEGDTASFTTRRGEALSGPCKTIPARLAVMPDRPPHGSPGGNNGDQPPPPSNR